MQVTLPTTMLRQITSEALTHKDVTCVATIHHPTGNIDSYSGNVFSRVSIPDVLHWPTMDSHPYRHARLRVQSLTDFQGALSRALYRTGEDQSHAVAGRQDDELPCCFGFARRFRIADNLIQLLKRF